MTSSLSPYDAVLLLSFGGPERPEDVVPFLRNVTRGRGIPDERLREVGEHYYGFGGKSPINDQNRALLAALEAELAARGLHTRLAWGNRNWDPYLVDALRDLHEAGARRVLAVATSAFGSYSGCRQYRENIAAAQEQLAAEGRVIDVDKIRPFFNSPGYSQANIEAVVSAYGELGVAPSPENPLVFVTHSIPTTMEVASGMAAPASYSGQHFDLAAVIAAGAAERLGAPIPWELAYCSRSGTAYTPWTEPDVNRVLSAAHEGGAAGVVLAPIGFISDHMEVIYDLDTEARATAERLELGFARAATAGTHPDFVSWLVELLVERAATERGQKPERRTVGALGAWPDKCAPGCCFLRAGIDSGVPAACGATAPAPV